jgi:hypothetical protein
MTNLVLYDCGSTRRFTLMSLPHGLRALREGEIGSTMLVAKGSLFLGRMTELADGMSILLEPGKE